MIVFSIIVVAIVLGVTYGVTLLYSKYKFHRDKLSFRESLSLTGLPIISVIVADKSMNFLLDTGCNCNCIDKAYVERVINSSLEKQGNNTGISGEAGVYGGANMEFYINDQKFNANFHIMDLTHAIHSVRQNGVDVVGILGSTFFNEHKYVLDYKDKVFYARKNIFA